MVESADESRATDAAEAVSDRAAPAAISWPVVISILSGLAAAWLAAGSTGLLSHPLRRGLTLAALGVAVLAGLPGPRRSAVRIAVVSWAAVVAVAMVASGQAPVNVLAAAVVLAALCRGRSGPDRRAMTVAAASVAVLGVYYLARTSIPTVWSLADAVGGALGRLAGLVTFRPLWVGATMAGLDFLVLSAAFLVGWLVAFRSRRVARGLYAAGAVLAVHLAYLLVLTCAADILQKIPDPPAEAGWTWQAAARTLVPWNLPLLAAAAHLAVVGAILRWWPVPAGQPAPRRTSPLLWAPVVALAVLTPVATVLSVRGGTMEGKKVVVYEEGYLNWMRPTHGDYGRLSIGMYGMLKPYVESLGGQCVISPDLSAEDMNDADVLILLYPNEPWRADQLDRIWDFVFAGGSLAVFGEHTVHEPTGAFVYEGPAEGTQRVFPAALAAASAMKDDPKLHSTRFNEVLAPTSMRVRFDSATFAVGGWLQTYEALAHPATLGVGDDRNQFGVVIGASVDAAWPAKPLLAGRWGWNDPGDQGGSAMMGNGRYDPGEKLGDLVLAAEQPLGAGRVIVFGDTSSMTNGITVGAHVFSSRLLGYLAGRSDSNVFLVQLAGIVCAAGVACLLVYTQDPRQVAAAAVLLAAGTVACVEIGARAGEVLPDGRGGASGARLDDRVDAFWLRPAGPSRLAYVDTTHMEAYSRESWRAEGTMGLTLTLMRNGYQVLDLPTFSPERLAGAGLLVSIAPAKPFSHWERQTLREWVRAGGIFICTVGYDRSAGSGEMLADFGLMVGHPPDKRPPGLDEPQPMGHFKSTYHVGEGYRSYVRYWAGWPVAAIDPPKPTKDLGPGRAIAYGRGGDAIILVRRYRKGKVVLVGDTCFAMNKNLERRDGRPIEGRRENAHFWRWLLTGLRGEPAWTPPPPPPPARPGEGAR